ncbi:MAG: 4Fe-4S binding protein [Deltaproteobacteria bacterium]|nr:4Fe-4S binding protein [Deltaproteobacteria bacterium]
MMAAQDVYQKLQRHLDKMPVGFPATESGVEIRILKHLFNPEEAEIALNLSALSEPLERIHRRVKGSGISIEKLEQVLDRLVEKGAIMGGKMLSGKTNGKYYSKAQLAIGMFEFQVDRITREFAQDFFQYMDEGFAEEFHRKKTSQMRTIPINRSLTPEHHVGNYDDARQLIMNSSGPCAVINCICRQSKDLLDEPCKLSDIRETCITLQNIAEVCLDSGMGRALTKYETLELLDRAEKVGMVLQPENNQNPLFICCCCGCCCGVLTSVKKFPRPVEYFHANFFAEVDPDLCEGCETCLERCQMDAISIMDSIANVNLDRCIGCGLCVTTCEANAMHLKEKEKGSVPPKDHDSLYKKIMMERFGPWRMFKMMVNMSLGRKI